MDGLRGRGFFLKRIARPCQHSQPGAGANARRPIDQKRQSYRASIEFPIVYVVDGREGTRSASANDLSVAAAFLAMKTSPRTR